MELEIYVHDIQILRNLQSHTLRAYGHTSAIDYTHCDHNEAVTASVTIRLIVSRSLWVIDCYRNVD